jgi:hypothetical protein
MLGLSFPQLNKRNDMDYNELLFAFHVRKEALERMRKEFTGHLTEKAIEAELGDFIRIVLHETIEAAQTIQAIQEG